MGSLSMLDQCALDLDDIGAALAVFLSGRATIHEARQAIARRKLEQGWLPRRRTVTR